MPHPGLPREPLSFPLPAIGVATMFGNKAGWIISALMAGVVVFVVWFLAGLNAISAPSTGVVARTGNVQLNLLQNPSMLDEIKLPVEPTTIVPSMTSGEDAAPLYRQAVETYLKNKYDYDIVDSRGQVVSTDLARFPALKFIIEAKDRREMNLYKTNPDGIIDYKSYPPTIEALYKMGKSLEKLSLILIAREPERKKEALAIGESLFSLGYKLCNERLRWYEFYAGQELLRSGCYLIGKCDESRAAVTKDADDKMKKLVKDTAVPLWTAIGSVDQEVIARTAGDVFYIAKNSKERLWRIEAVLKLGRYKYNVGEPGHGPNQRWARIWVKRMANNPNEDPAVRVAAQKANDLTIEDYNMIN